MSRGVTGSYSHLRPNSVPVSEVIDQLKLDPKALGGQIAVVTGSARGIGEQAARGLAHLGAHVVLVDVLDRGAEVAQSIRDAGQQATFILADITTDLNRVERALEDIGPVDILVNNAVQIDVHSILEISDEEWDYIQGTNLRAPFMLVKKLLPGMLERKRGVIANMIAVEGMAFSSAMSSSKVGLRSLMISLAAEVPSHSGVSIFGFAPGLVATDMVLDVFPRYTDRIGVSFEDFIFEQQHNPGYVGLMPPEHCGAGLVHALLNAEEHHGLVADPYGPLAQAGLIAPIPEVETEPPLPKSARRLHDYIAEIRQLNDSIEHKIEQRTQVLEREKAQSHALASMGMLAAGVAHEINNPLTYIIGNLEQLTESLGRAEDQQTLIEETRSAAKHIQAIVSDIKLFSRMEAEHKNQAVDLTRVIDGTLRLVHTEVRYRARLVRLDQGAPKIFANESRIAQVLVNLLVNAAQAIPAGQVDDNEIRVTTRADENGNAVVEIRDSGCGINTQDLDQIFEPFFTTKDVGTGTGLGLSICKSIIEGFGGQIDVTSRSGEGTTVQVTLPAIQQEIVEMTTSESPISAEPKTEARILIIDDDPLIASVLQRTLKKYQVSVATNGPKALEMLTAEPDYDLVFCDLMMPNMTGMELHARLSESNPKTLDRLIFMTGGAFTDHAADFLDDPNIRSIQKPFDTKTIRELVRDALTPKETSAPVAPAT